MKKIMFFIIGFFIVPMIMGGITAFVFNPQDYELYAGFWGSVYLLIYIIFPLLYRPKIKQKMSNTRHLGRKLDDSLPDFATFVVSRCRKWGKRDAL